MWNQSELTKKLGIKYPIIQGPFGGGLSTIRLLSAVSNAGGMGSFGAHILSPSGIHELISNIRKETDKPFAINLWVSDHDKGGLGMQREAFNECIGYFKPYYDALNIEPPEFPDKYTEYYEEQVEALIEAAPPVFSFVYGIPGMDILEQCRKKGITTIGAVTTLDEALAMENAGVDIILATGLEAGGHRVSFMGKPEDSLYGGLALIPQIVDRVNVPVISAGGIVDARGVKAALALGAQGVQIGTAFLACEESGTSTMHREVLFSEASYKTVLSRAFTGRLARFIPNEFINSIEQSKELPLPFPIQSFFTSTFKKAANEQENQHYASLYAGQGAPLLKHKKALDLIEAITTEMN
ncbi:NAD(P)H-dependent flavin oxidoreductase [Microbulbifer sp. EKSA008]|uniref:NAD(P)H-dependent flavin oxidoreductase n=1 Tax=Microbulbifer sp. EKSA008 TaxID=3243367 RepID=UPI0040422E85